MPISFCIISTIQIYKICKMPSCSLGHMLKSPGVVIAGRMSAPELKFDYALTAWKFTHMASLSRGARGTELNLNPTFSF